MDEEQPEDEPCSVLSLGPVPVSGKSRHSINVLFPVKIPLQWPQLPQTGLVPEVGYCPFSLAPPALAGVGSAEDTSQSRQQKALLSLTDMETSA